MATASGHIFIPPPKNRPFATTTSNILPLRRLAVDRELCLDGGPALEHGEGRPEVRRFRTELLRGVIRALRDRPAHPGACDVRKHRGGFAAVPGAVADPAEIDGLRVALERDSRRRHHVVGNAERPDEVAPRPARNQGQRRGVLDPCKPVYDLVERPVAADDDEEARATGGCLPGESTELATVLADQRIPFEPHRPRPCGRTPANGARWRRWPLQG